MTAMNWLATQLAWEQRLVELRSESPAQLTILHPADQTEARRAA